MQTIYFMALIYLLIGCALYFLLRYFIDIEPMKAVIIIAVLLTITGFSNFIYNYMNKEKDCNMCIKPNLEHLEPNLTLNEQPKTDPVVTPINNPTTTNPAANMPGTTNPTCRIVCDEDTKVTTAKQNITVVENGFEPVGFGGMYYDNYKPGSINTGFVVTPDKTPVAEEAYDNVIRAQIEAQARGTKFTPEAYQAPGNKSQTRQDINQGRTIYGDIDNDLPYSDYNHLPVAVGYKSHDYEYGYSFIPPEKWYNTPPRPPICVTDQRAQVLPMYANGTPMDVKEFNTYRRITPPDRINVSYIQDKLNAGV